MLFLVLLLGELKFSIELIINCNTIYTVNPFRQRKKQHMKIIITIIIIIEPRSNTATATVAVAAAADDVSQVLNTNVPINYLGVCNVCSRALGLGLEKGLKNICWDKF